HVGNRAQNQDILPRDMVGRDHQRSARVEPAMKIDADAEQPAGNAVPVSWERAADVQIERQPDELERQENQGNRQQREGDEADPQPGDQASSLSSGTPYSSSR